MLHYCSSFPTDELFQQMNALIHTAASNGKKEKRKTEINYNLINCFNFC